MQASVNGRSAAVVPLESKQRSVPFTRSAPQPWPRPPATLPSPPPTISRFAFFPAPPFMDAKLAPYAFLPLSFFLQPFFVLHKASAAAASSVPSSRARRRIDASLPSSPNPKSAKRTRDVDAQDEEDSELCERFRLEAFHRIWSRIQSTIDVCPSRISLIPFRVSILTSSYE